MDAVTPKIHFDCTLCGECCCGSMKVFLNSYDLFKMASFLKMNHSDELFKRHFVILDQGQNTLNLPRIRFKTKPFPFCPHLINDLQEDLGLRGLCSLHKEHKPLICQLAPFSRKLDLKTGEDEFTYTLPHPGCPGSSGIRVLNIEEEKASLAKELDFEKRYYTLLSQNEEDSQFLWSFPLTQTFENLLTAWEKGLKP
ncbi:YkgJ family cysteine cluster protein [Oceanispirochaeta crateris]|nr:YkgJ family cysteine cluster protein [Oceanispirochaeta crateris]